jgi:DNA-binding CsgD family transcriptional regulator
VYDFYEGIYASLNTSLFVLAAILSVVFIGLVFIIFDRYRGKTLAASLYAILHSGDAETGAADTADGTADAAGLTESQALAEADFTEDEKKVVMLLIDGGSRGEILRKLRINANEFSKYEKAIRLKIFNIGDPDPVIAAVAAEYHLTRREIEVARCLRRDMTNTEIAAELFISASTVKFHVHNLLTKMNAETRQHLAGWFNELEKKL